MSTYHLEITENERILLILALGCAEAHKIGPIVFEQSEPPASAIVVTQRMTFLSSVNNPRTVPSAPTPAPAPPAPVIPAAPKDPDVRELGPITPLSIERTGTGKKECLVMTWQTQDGGRKVARCWADQKMIWPRVLERVKQPTVFLVKEKSAYLNIVGVKS